MILRLTGHHNMMSQVPASPRRIQGLAREFQLKSRLYRGQGRSLAGAQTATALSGRRKRFPRTCFARTSRQSSLEYLDFSALRPFSSTPRSSRHPQVLGPSRRSRGKYDRKNWPETASPRRSRRPGTCRAARPGPACADRPAGLRHRRQPWRKVVDITQLERSPLDVLTMTVRQVVEHDRTKPRLGQRQAAVRADIAGAASDQYAFHKAPRLRRSDPRSSAP